MDYASGSAGPNIQLSPDEVTWMNVMVAESAVMGLRLAAANFPPPSENDFTIESLIFR